MYIMAAEAGVGEAMEGSQLVDMRGGCPGFVHQSEDVIPCDVLDHRLWPADPRAARELG